MHFYPPELHFLQAHQTSSPAPASLSNTTTALASPPQSNISTAQQTTHGPLIERRTNEGSTILEDHHNHELTNHFHHQIQQQHQQHEDQQQKLQEIHRSTVSHEALATLMNGKQGGIQENDLSGTVLIKMLREIEN